MASSISVTCPECDKEFRVPAAVEGKKIRCKACGATIPVKAGKSSTKAKSGKGEEKKSSATAKPAAKPNVVFDDEGDGKYGLTDTEDSIRCPHCAKEMESADAIICLFCGYNTVTRSHTEVKRTIANTPMDHFKWLLPGILCVLGIIGLIIFDIWFCNLDYWKDVEYKSFATGPRVWVTFILCCISVGLGKFAFKRLVVNPVRPEKVKY